jgi:TRAP-type C4-dicarboxylate transport system permease small subunit
MKNEENKNDRAKTVIVKIITSIAIFVVVSGFMLSIGEDGAESAKETATLILFIGLCVLGISLAIEKWGKK